MHELMNYSDEKGWAWALCLSWRSSSSVWLNGGLVVSDWRFMKSHDEVQKLVPTVDPTLCLLLAIAWCSGNYHICMSYRLLGMRRVSNKKRWVRPIPILASGDQFEELLGICGPSRACWLCVINRWSFMHAEVLRRAASPRMSLWPTI